MYVDETSLGKHFAIERDTRRAYRTACKALGEDPSNNSRLRCNKKDGRVGIDHVPTIKGNSVKGETSRLNFNEAHLLKIKITRKGIADPYEKEPPNARDGITCK